LLALRCACSRCCSPFALHECGAAVRAFGPACRRAPLREGNTNGTLRVSVGGGPTPVVQFVPCAISGNWATYVACATTQSFSVPQGVSVVRIEVRQRRVSARASGRVSVRARLAPVGVDAKPVLQDGPWAGDCVRLKWCDVAR
jgi:hypothetical protein